jgi:hypothetical protein
MVKMAEENKKRAGRNIKVNVTDELPPGVTEEEYQILESLAEGKSLNDLIDKKRADRHEKREESKKKTADFIRKMDEI